MVSISSPLPDELIAEFRRIRDEVQRLRGQAEDGEPATSPRFSFLKILDCQRREVAHSNFLAALLNPSGTHAQGPLFLKHFLNYCVANHPVFGALKNTAALYDQKQWKVRTEASVEEGRADILLEYAPASKRVVGIIIENKIDATEGQSQLEKYGEFIDRNYLIPALAYLTLTGKKSETCGENYKERYACLSYAVDIDKWLSGCLDDIKSPGVKETVMQYLHTIRNLNNEGGAMAGDEEIKKYLAEPENIEIALGIERYAKVIRAELQERFTTELAGKLDDRLAIVTQGRRTVYCRGIGTGTGSLMLQRRTTGISV